jgi:hypothetical protein
MKSVLGPLFERGSVGNVTPGRTGVLMGEDRASVVFTDLPYNVPIEGHVSGLG